MLGTIFLFICSFLFELDLIFTKIIPFVVFIGIFAGLLIGKKLRVLVIVGLIPFISFIFYDINYMFISLLCLVLGILGMNILKPEIKIGMWFYSLIGVLLFLHVLWWNFLPLGYFEEYNLDIGDSRDFSGDLYLVPSESLGERTCVGETCFREINNSAQIRFDKKHLVDNYLVGLKYDSLEKIYLNGKIVYNPAWENFSKVGSYNEYDIYSRENISKVSGLSFLERGDEVFANFEIENVLTTGNFEEEYFENFENYEKVNFDEHNTNQTFRGNIKFLGYFNSSINLSFVKQDMNWYEGEEDLNVSIYNFTGEYIDSFVVEDDGFNDTNKNVSPQNISKDIKLPSKGFYYVDFRIVENSGDDVEVINLSVNTNKFVSVNYVYLRGSGRVYFRDLDTINYRYYHRMNQSINLSSEESFRVVYNDSLKAKWLEMEISNGSYFEMEEGNLMFKSDQEIFLGYWNDSVIKNRVVPKFLFVRDDFSKENEVLVSNSDKLSLLMDGKLYSVRVNIER